jgi:hypothetical protein
MAGRFGGGAGELQLLDFDREKRLP